MRDLFVTLLVVLIFLSGTKLFADQIYLSGGKIVSGKVIMVGREKVEYMPAQGITSKYITKSKIIKIVYDNNQQTVFRKEPVAGEKIPYKNDVIYLKDGSVKYGKVLRVTKMHVEYNPVGKHPFDLCKKDEVIKIIYKDGKEVYFDKKYAKSSVDKEEQLAEDPSNWYIGCGLGIMSGFANFKGVSDIFPQAGMADDDLFMGYSLNFNIGYVLSEHWNLGFDLTVSEWSGENDDSDDNPEIDDDLTWFLFTADALVSVKMFPDGGQGIFWKISGGYTGIDLTLMDDGETTESKSAGGVTIHIGGGYDWKVHKSFHIAINVEYFHNYYFDDKYFSNANGVIGYMTLYWK